MRNLFTTLLYITLLISFTLASSTEEESLTTSDNNNAGENQSAELKGEALTDKVTPSSGTSDKDIKARVEESEKNDEKKKQDTKKNIQINKISTKLKNRMAIVKEMYGNHQSSEEKQVSDETESEGPAPCTCGIFLSGQFKKGSKDQPKGLPVLEQEIDTPFMDNAIGNRQCMHRCLEVIIKHLPKSNDIICATVDKDHVHREKAYLFIKNHSHKWHETKMSAGREFCCKDNLPYKCNKSKRSILSSYHR